MDKQEVKELQRALEGSVKLQSYYAKMLNAYDGGERLEFKDADEWVNHIVNLVQGENTKQKPRVFVFLTPVMLGAVKEQACSNKQITRILKSLTCECDSEVGCCCEYCSLTVMLAEFNNTFSELLKGKV